MIVSSFFSDNKIIFSVYMVCAAIHELGHIFVARIMKIKIQKISLDFAGAKIYPTMRIQSYKKEWLLCAAGPFMNILTAFFSVLFVKNVLIQTGHISDTVIYMLDGVGRLMETGKRSAVSVSGLFFVLSLFQAIVNLLPISTLDGGRMTKCLLASLLNEEGARRLTSAASFAFALALWMVSVYLLIRTNAGLAVFVFSLCMFLKIMNSEAEL